MLSCKSSKDNIAVNKHSTSSNGGSNLCTGAVAAKIQRIKQLYRNNQANQSSGKDIANRELKQDFLPISKLALNYLSSSTQEIANDLSANQTNKNNFSK